ncbi:magnesium transporter [Mycoplasmopsis meleagridis]|uniref:magnesium transporter n=1 Tax=Mycoplasmopsis meleagridis TaxID=29561 RepID=UPI00073D2CDD|nr:magnesium transporter [Mycoplasmopsis meleagridis]KUH47404.1 magnesium transporter [Mycoplasmopsis meleagridis]
MNENIEYSTINELIESIVKSKDKKLANQLVDEYPIALIAEALEEIDLENIKIVLKTINGENAAEIFSYLSEDKQKQLAETFNDKWEMNLLQNLQSDELADVLDELPENVSSKILAYTPSDRREDLHKLMRYSDDQVGSIMSIDISAINNQYTCEQALNKIRRDYQKKNAELVHYYFVIDEMEKLLGVLTLEEIVFANPNTKIDSLYSPVASITADDKKEYASQIFSEHDMSVLPIVNDDKRLIGMITSDDVIDVINDEATMDIFADAGISSKDSKELDYLKTPWYKLVKNRIFWLLITLIFSTIIQIFINLFVVKISDGLEVILASLLPAIVLIASASSRQTFVTIKRNLALQEIDEKDYKKVLLKELVTASIIGLIIAFLNILRLYIYYGATGDLASKHYKYSHIIIWASSITLFLTIIISSLIGVLIPYISTKHKKDISFISTILLANIASLVATLLMIGLTSLFSI